ncbi:MAG TPA: hypothetical protein VHG28_10795 [Longimicrobiaceae bacterium]|nr:hypothetical protein [Longimicrobiaceae bacterium]
MGTPSAEQARELACSGCGAGLKFGPGTESLTCPYCGAHTPVPAVLGGTEELDFQAYLARVAAREETYEVLAARCRGCGAESTLDLNVVSDECPFCGDSLIPASQSRRLIKPTALLPFRITRAEAEQALERWMRGLWFAPNDFKRSARREGGITGMYLPFWTFDCEATSRYTGARGEWYWVSETYTTTENGRTVRRTRQVRKTRWYPASGTVHDSFDDVLVPASDSLPRRETDALQPWDLESLVAYSEEYLSGFRTESYKVSLDQGFEAAKPVMAGAIHTTICRDIGGDEQQVHSVHTRYDDVTFKHVLLPVWISAYRYRDRVYRRLVNARTGEVQGERPWSWVKIALLVLVLLAVVFLVVLLSEGDSSTAALLPAPAPLAAGSRAA